MLAHSLRQMKVCNLGEILLHRRDGYSQRNSEDTDAKLVAWDIVSMWLTGITTNNLDTRTPLREAEDWFLQGSTSERLTGLLSATEIRHAEKTLPNLLNPQRSRELLPYILDPHGPGSRLSVRRDPRTGVARRRKRAHGVFYTPTDVASYMVKGCLDALGTDDSPIIFDPACGTGVFLRTALRELSIRNSDKNAFMLATECLFGTDLSPWATDASTFVLLVEILGTEIGERMVPGELWRQLRLNLACVDTLRVDPVDAKFEPSDDTHESECRVPLSRLFPTMKDNPTTIVGNPPYSDLGSPPHFRNLIRQFKTLHVNPKPTAEVYVAFIEQMLRLANRDSFAGALVLPLSIATNVGVQFSAARRLVQETSGQWRFAFFDREPQALFGEDVKTRNAIVFWQRNSLAERAQVATGPLRRWRSGVRATMFDAIRFTPLDLDITAGIPKIEGEGQVSAYDAVNARWERLESAVISVKRIKLADALSAEDNVVFVGNTAYNFLNVFLRPPRQVFRRQVRFSENQLHAIHCATSQQALAVFAMFTSHLAYWWWHTMGDGFHVSRRFIAGFPFGSDVLTGHRLDLLSKSGSDLWSAIESQPTMSLNRGRTSIAFDPNPHNELRRPVDELLVDNLGLDSRFIRELQRFTERMIAAIPEFREYTNLPLKGW